jgi:hypothetical protein
MLSQKVAPGKCELLRHGRHNRGGTYYRKPARQQILIVYIGDLR